MYWGRCWRRAGRLDRHGVEHVGEARNADDWHAVKIARGRHQRFQRTRLGLGLGAASVARAAFLAVEADDHGPDLATALPNFFDKVDDGVASGHDVNHNQHPLAVKVDVRWHCVCPRSSQVVSAPVHRRHVHAPACRRH